MHEKVRLEMAETDSRILLILLMVVGTLLILSSFVINHYKTEVKRLEGEVSQHEAIAEEQRERLRYIEDRL